MSPRLRLLRSLLVAALVVGASSAAAFDWPQWASALQGDEERVLVFLVGSRERVADVRASVDPDRIVVETPDAIALREGRIVATDVDAVPGPYTQAGWMEREIEIMNLQRVEWWKGSSARRRRAPHAAAADPARMARIQELLQKGTLSAGEQLFLLQAMNDGIEF